MSKFTSNQTGKNMTRQLEDVPGILEKIYDDAGVDPVTGQTYPDHYQMSKLCKSCGEQKSRGRGKGHFGAKPDRPHLLKGSCNDCYAARQRVKSAEKVKATSRAKRAEYGERNDAKTKQSSFAATHGWGGRKTCPQCGVAYGCDGFYRNRANLDGVSAYCTGCTRDAIAESGSGEVQARKAARRAHAAKYDVIVDDTRV